jgi:hypothetical protein
LGDGIDFGFVRELGGNGAVSSLRVACAFGAPLASALRVAVGSVTRSSVAAGCGSGAGFAAATDAGGSCAGVAAVAGGDSATGADFTGGSSRCDFAALAAEGAGSIFATMPSNQICAPSITLRATSGNIAGAAAAPTASSTAPATVA